MESEQVPLYLTLLAIALHEILGVPALFPPRCAHFAQFKGVPCMQCAFGAVLVSSFVAKNVLLTDVGQLKAVFCAT